MWKAGSAYCRGAMWLIGTNDGMATGQGDLQEERRLVRVPGERCTEEEA